MYLEEKAKMAAPESKQPMDRRAERPAAELRQAKEALAVEMFKQAKEALQFASAAHAKKEARLLQQAIETVKALSSDSEGPSGAIEFKTQAKKALTAELKLANLEALQSASAAHVTEESRLLQQASDTVKALMSSDSEGTNFARCNCNKCCESAASPRSFYCTACGKKNFEVREVCEHPMLHGVGICMDCHNFVLSSPFTKDIADNVDEQCRWCGQGGSIIMCGQCDKVFCKSCIVRNFGKLHGLDLILKMKDWKCFCCSPALLAVHVDELNAFREAKIREARHVHLQTQSENAELLLAQERKERHNQNSGIQTISRKNNKSINQASCSKRNVTLDNEHTTCQKKPRCSIEVEEPEDIEKQPAPTATATPARTYIRPYQMIEKRREARERRARTAAERLESGITNLQNNGPNDQNLDT